MKCKSDHTNYHLTDPTIACRVALFVCTHRKILSFQFHSREQVIAKSILLRRKEKTKVKRILIPAISLFLVVVLAACSATTTPTTQQASQEYCQALGAYARSVVQLHQFNETSTINEFKDAQIAAQQAYADLIEASSQVREAQTLQIKTTTNNLSQAVKDISTSMTVNEAIASIQDELAAVESAIAASGEAVHCTIPTPVPTSTATPVPTETPVPTPTTSAVTTAQTQLCTDLAAYEAAVVHLDSLTGDSTIEQVQEAQKAVDDAWATVKQSASQVPAVKIDNLDQATQNLSKAVNDIKSSMTFAEAKESIADELQAVQAAHQELSTSASCKAS